MDYFVLTSCTQRKRTGLSEALRPDLLQPGSYAKTAKSWIRFADQSATQVPAIHLYIGRSVKEANAAARHLGASLYFISAGFGLLHEATAVPNYDLTVAPSSSSLETTIRDIPFSSAKWWLAINRARGSAPPLQLLLGKHPNAIFLFALSRSYLEMVQEDLNSIDPNEVTRLRFFTSTDGARAIPESVRSAWMPYDERFDGHGSPNPGTRSDFPQRILNHFVHHVLNPKAPDLEAERTRVLRLLSKYSVRRQPERQRKTDSELISVIHQHWGQARGQATRMLRILRDDLLISCEQKRFASLFRAAKWQREEHRRGA